MIKMGKKRINYKKLELEDKIEKYIIENDITCIYNFQRLLKWDDSILCDRREFMKNVVELDDIQKLNKYSLKEVREIYRIYHIGKKIIARRKTENGETVDFPYNEVFYN